MANEHAEQGRFKVSQSSSHTGIRETQEESMNPRLGTAVFAGLAFLGLATVSPNAATFAAWQVTDVAFGDTLNVRKYPSGSSQKQSAYPNGTVLQMTGKCTGGTNLLDISGQPEWKQRQLVRYRWCQIWHDPAQNGKFVTGWVYGRYIEPY